MAKHDNHKLLHSPAQSIDSTGINSLKSIRTLGSTRTSDSDKSSTWKQRKSSCLSGSISLGDAITNYGNIPKPKLLLDRRDTITGHSSRVFSIQFHPLNENEFISGGWDNLILFWDKRTQKAVGSIFGPHICGESIDVDTNGQENYCGKWATDGVAVCGGTDPNSLRIVNTVKNSVSQLAYEHF
ncbi:hypothetical protein J437_LFUL006878 [Ladona fulva]|uniref:Uncharacterized protein n=1 Tax=Ladona fulva TaxID=123851 RepID=A0A8K0P2X8_LADFU|nr:hypothetical protein J437_LFUL006878 [Ladona fulva]